MRAMRGTRLGDCTAERALGPARARGGRAGTRAAPLAPNRRNVIESFRNSKDRTHICCSMWHNTIYHAVLSAAT